MIPTELPLLTAIGSICLKGVQQQVYRHRLLPNMQRAVVSRNRQRNVAEHYPRALKRLHAEASYILVCDPIP
jgi:hypothetical protein